MKNKKIVAFLAVLMAALLLFASCTKPGENTSNTETTTGEGTTGTPDPKTEPLTDPVQLQAYYETYFTSEDLKYAGAGMTITIDSNPVKTNLKINETDFEMYIGENGLGMYRSGDTNYLHIVLVDDETHETSNSWYKSPVTEDQDLSSMVDDFKIDFDPSVIKTVKYIETQDINGKKFDVVEVVAEEIVTDEDADNVDSSAIDSSAVESSGISETNESSEDAEIIINEKRDEIITTEYTFFITNDTHEIFEMLASTEEWVLDENDDPVSSVTNVACSFYEPSKFVVPQDIVIEEMSPEEFEEAFGFALLTVMFASMFG